jgi:hypothetical protein
MEVDICQKCLIGLNLDTYSEETTGDKVKFTL